MSERALQVGVEEAWRIRDERDARYDGILFIAITTTRIYCKPSCPSRHANPGNVRFFNTWSEAEGAGYRACLRCRPRDENNDAVLVRAVTGYIEAHPDEPVTLAHLSAAAGVSPFHLQRRFKKATGVTPHAWSRNQRIQRFQTSLRTAASVTDAVYEAGFATSSRAYENAQQKLGMKPAVWRKGGEGVQISYTVAPTEFGVMLAAATARGICCVMLGDSADALEAEFAGDFPRAERTRDEKLGLLVDQILVLITTQGPSPHLPVDVRATAFQQRVWDYLRAIPRGETRSYSQVAADLDEPAATRAVARACATNPVALVVPCHRVVGANGKLTGYRWGLERKQNLLKTEGAR